MTTDNSGGRAVAERVRAADISVGDSSSVEAMLANSLREQKPLADTGKLYDSIQAAENDASAFIFVPPGTFNEDVTIGTAGLTLLGSGEATTIIGSHTSNANNTTIKNISIDTDDIGLDINGSNTTVDSVHVYGSVNIGINADGANSTVTNCRIEGGDTSGIGTGVTGLVIKNCIIDGSSVGMKLFNGDQVITNNIIKNASLDGIQNRNSPDTVIGGNRIINCGDDGIEQGAADCILFNNRVSDCATDINDSGTGTTLDGNLTGASN